MRHGLVQVFVQPRDVDVFDTVDKNEKFSVEMNNVHFLYSN